MKWHSSKTPVKAHYCNQTNNITTIFPKRAQTVLLLLFFLINIFNAYEIEGQVNVSSKQRIYVSKSGELSTYSNEIDIPVYGSPFFNEGFNIGSVYFYNKNVLDSIPVLFDILNNSVGYYKASTKDTVALVKEYIHHFNIHLKDTTLLFKRINMNAGKNKLPDYQFVKVLHEGKQFDLYKHLYSNILKEKDIRGTSERAILRKEEKIYLLRNKDFEIIELTQNRKILKYLDNKKAKIKSYLKTNNLNLKDEKSLVSTLNYYEEMSASE